MKLLTLSEIVMLADTIHPGYRALILLAGTGGLRMGEFGALRAKRVGFRRSAVEVTENLVRTKHLETLWTEVEANNVCLPERRAI